MKRGHYQLHISVVCERCGIIIYSEVWKRYQTKGGRWESGIHILKENLEPHDCAQAERRYI